MMVGAASGGGGAACRRRKKRREKKAEEEKKNKIMMEEQKKRKEQEEEQQKKIMMMEEESKKKKEAEGDKKKKMAIEGGRFGYYFTAGDVAKLAHQVLGHKYSERTIMSIRNDINYKVICCSEAAQNLKYCLDDHADPSSCASKVFALSECLTKVLALSLRRPGRHPGTHWTLLSSLDSSCCCQETYSENHKIRQCHCPGDIWDKIKTVKVAA